MNTLCKDENESGCPDDTGGCGCNKPATTQYGDKGPKPCDKIGEWGLGLIDPDTYCQKLDDAWKEYSDKKNELADALAELKKCTDELAGLEAKRKADTEGLDKAVDACLKSSWKNEDCCKETETRKAGY